jgi:flagellar hook-length control protein FliK
VATPAWTPLYAAPRAAAAPATPSASAPARVTPTTVPAAGTRQTAADLAPNGGAGTPAAATATVLDGGAAGGAVGAGAQGAGASLAGAPWLFAGADGAAAGLSGGAAGGEPAGAHGPSAGVQRQVAVQLLRQEAALTESGRVTLRLDPPELGRVEVTLERRGEQLTVTFAAETATAERALRDGTHELAQILTVRGGRWQDVQVRVADRDDEAAPDGRDGRDGRGERDAGGRQERGRGGFDGWDGELAG